MPSGNDPEETQVMGGAVNDPFETPDGELDRPEDDPNNAPDEEAEANDAQREIDRLLSIVDETQVCTRKGCRGCDRLMPPAPPSP